MLENLNKNQQRCVDNLRAWENYRSLPLGDKLRIDKDRLWLLPNRALERVDDPSEKSPFLATFEQETAATGMVRVKRRVLDFMQYAGSGKTAHGSTAVATFRENVPFASVQLTFHKITPGLNDEDFYAKVPEARGALSVLEWDVDAGNPSYGDLVSLGLHALEVLKNHLLRRKTNPFNIEKLFRARGIL